MNAGSFLNGEMENKIWNKINADLEKDSPVFTYNTDIEQDGYHVVLDIDIDPGGGFESGYATTSFTALLKAEPHFRFAIHKEHFTDEIGKFFGMQDVLIGYKDFDNKLIIKTNDKTSVRKLFSSPQLREIIAALEDFTFGIHHHTNNGVKSPYLELMIEDGITDAVRLRQIFNAFYVVLTLIE